jgi:serine/threonine protein kinase
MESIEFCNYKGKGINYYYRKDFSLDDIKNAIKIHLKYIQEEPLALIKNSSRTKISIFENRGIKICVKQFCYPSLWSRLKENFRYSKGIKSWINGNDLRAKGISSIKPMALIERRNRLGLIESFFIMEAPEKGEELGRYILKGFKDVRRKIIFIKSFAKWLSDLHQKNIYHKDMKASNILILEKECSWDFLLIDMEDFEMGKSITEKKLLKNLIQLNTSIPNNIKTTDRFRFFYNYLRLNPIIKDKKIFIRRLLEAGKRI